jgi:hypothetical protein
MTYHEIILGKKPYEKLDTRVVEWFKRLKDRKHYDDDTFEELSRNWKDPMTGEHIWATRYLVHTCLQKN